MIWDGKVVTVNGQEGVLENVRRGHPYYVTVRMPKVYVDMRLRYGKTPEPHYEAPRIQVPRHTL